MYRKLMIAAIAAAAVSFTAEAQNQGNQRNRDNQNNNQNERRENRAEDYSSWKQTKTSMDKLPGAVKAAFGKEANQDKVTNVMELSKDGKTVYQAEISKAEGERGRMVRVDSSGQVMKEVNTTERGRESVSYETLPGEVKSTISKLTEGKQPDQITQVTRGGETFYRFQHKGNPVFVGKNGKVLTEAELPK